MAFPWPVVLVISFFNIFTDSERADAGAGSCIIHLNMHMADTALLANNKFTLAVEASSGLMEREHREEAQRPEAISHVLPTAGLSRLHSHDSATQLSCTQSVSLISEKR